MLPMLEQILLCSVKSLLSPFQEILFVLCNNLAVSERTERVNGKVTHFRKAGAEKMIIHFVSAFNNYSITLISLLYAKINYWFHFIYFTSGLG